jgi:SAM-dependent methyltransferase
MAMSQRTPRAWVRRLRGGSPATTEASPESAPDLGALAHTWDVLGEHDPLWAVLTHPGTEGGRWDVEEFFRDGQVQVEAALSLVEHELGWSLATGTAMDFGCGVGRLTQALCDRFDRVDGVDIAPSMLRAAERFNRFGDRCRFHLNVRDDLSIFPDGAYDFIYSTYVLQHMHPTFARRYVEEFIRLLSPDGLALFQIPTAKRGPAPNEPMPDGWFPADQELVSAPPGTLPIGASAQLRLRVINRGPGTWPARGDRAVRVGARWRLDGSVVGEEARGELPTDLAPGAEAIVDLSLRAPGRPGHVVLECGLLQEGVAWFVDKGGTLARTEVDVVADDGAASADASGADGGEPPMEMHATPVAEVETWVRSAGGRVVSVKDAPPDENYDGVLFAVAR